MLIECKYYDVAAKEMEELDKQIAEESENLSEGELQLENDRRDFQLAEIIRSFKEKEKMKEIVPDSEKIALFIRLQRASMELAKLLELNIVTMKKDDDTYGYIELSYGISWILSDSPKMCKKTMAMLYENADQICSEVKDTVLYKGLSSNWRNRNDSGNIFDCKV